MPTFINLVTKNVPPISIIWGENDTIIPIELAEFLAEFGIKKNSTHKLIHNISNCWHSPPSNKLSKYLLTALTNPFYLKKIPINSIETLNLICSSCYATASPTDTIYRRNSFFSKIRKLFYI